MKDSVELRENQYDKFDDPATPAATQPLKLFPVIAGTKTPALSGDWRKHATSDPVQIEAWRAAGFNLGCDCAASGLAVIDLDGGEIGEASWAKLQGEHGIAPATREHRTPRGGRHLIYRGSIPSSVQKLGPKLDTRGVGGYIVWEGSTEDGSYSAIRDVEPTTVPVWIAPTLNASKSKHTAAVEELDLPVNVARAERYLRGLQPVVQGDGADARTYEVACALRDMAVSQERSRDMMVSLYDCTPQDDRFEAFIARKVKNVWEYAQNEPGAWGVTSGVERFASYASPASAPEPARAWAQAREDIQKRPVVLRDEGVMDQVVSVEMLVDGLIPHMVNAAVIGLPDAGKSHAVMDISLSVAAGVPVFKHFRVARPGPVVSFVGEYLIDLEQRRRLVWREAHSIDPARILPFYTIQGVPRVRTQEDVDRYLEALWQQQQKQGEPFSLIAIDNVARAMEGMNSNEDKEAGVYVGFADTVVREFKCSLISIHHTGRTGENPRGSNAFDAGYEVAIKSEVVGGEFSRSLTSSLSFYRYQRGKKPDPFEIKGHEHTYEDARFGVLTAPVFEHQAASAKASVQKPMTPTEKDRADFIIDNLEPALKRLDGAQPGGRWPLEMMAAEVLQVRQEIAKLEGEPAWTEDECAKEYKMLRTKLKRWSDPRPKLPAILDRYLARTAGKAIIRPPEFHLLATSDTVRLEKTDPEN